MRHPNPFLIIGPAVAVLLLLVALSVGSGHGNQHETVHRPKPVVNEQAEVSPPASADDGWSPGVTFGLSGPALEVAPGITIDLDGNVGIGGF
jgi:hypothetical protein